MVSVGICVTVEDIAEKTHNPNHSVLSLSSVIFKTKIFKRHYKESILKIISFSKSFIQDWWKNVQSA